jgi:hypothetical protein
MLSMDTPEQLIQADAARIALLGGPTKVAELLGFDKAQGGVQRVQNWLSRGIPSKVKLDHPHLFLGPARRPADAKA